MSYATCTMSINQVTKSALWWMFGILIVLSSVDFLLTKNYLSEVGMFGEFNPVMRWAAQEFGVNMIAIVKMIPLTLLALCILLLKPQVQWRLFKVLICVNVIMTLVVFQGIYVNTTL